MCRISTIQYVGQELVSWQRVYIAYNEISSPEFEYIELVDCRAFAYEGPFQVHVPISSAL